MSRGKLHLGDVAPAAEIISDLCVLILCLMVYRVAVAPPSRQGPGITTV